MFLDQVTPQEEFILEESIHIYVQECLQQCRLHSKKKETT